MCQTFLIFFLIRIRGVGDRSSRYVFSTVFGSVVESHVAFLQVKRLKNHLGEITVRQAGAGLLEVLCSRDSYCLLGRGGGSLKCSAVVTFCPRSVLLRVSISVLEQWAGESNVQGTKSSSRLWILWRSGLEPRVIFIKRRNG